jgi:hypothetical protein
LGELTSDRSSPHDDRTPARHLVGTSERPTRTSDDGVVGRPAGGGSAKALATRTVGCGVGARLVGRGDVSDTACTDGLAGPRRHLGAAPGAPDSRPSRAKSCRRPTSRPGSNSGSKLSATEGNSGNSAPRGRSEPRSHAWELSGWGPGGRRFRSCLPDRYEMPANACLFRRDPGSCFVDRSGPSHGTGAPGPPGETMKW